MFTEEFMLRNLIEKMLELRKLQDGFYRKFLRCLADDVSRAEHHIDELLKVFAAEVGMTDAAAKIQAEGEVTP